MSQYRFLRFEVICFQFNLQQEDIGEVGLLSFTFHRKLVLNLNQNCSWLRMTSFAYSYNSIKRICSIKRPGLEFFKNILLSVPYHR